jgi:uncharacterized protein YndB with AHSA1/START domain
MTNPHDAGTDVTAAPLVISRIFPAPRERVFAAWSTAAHMQRWFSPEHCSVPAAEVDFRPGGVCAICMRLPDGQEHWARGHFLEVVAPERLVLCLEVSSGGVVRFTAHTTVTFAEVADGTRMTVHQVYDIHDPAFRGAPEGAAEGWRTTLDKLARMLAGTAAADGRSVVHADFTLERVFAAAPAAVFRALTDPAAKARWFTGGEGYTVLEREVDVRPGGRERLRGRWASGVVTDFEAVYHDVVADARLVYSYAMHLDARKISVSLATLELLPAPGGTRLVVTEQGAFLDGYDDAGARARGTGDLMDRLGASLAG